MLKITISGGEFWDSSKEEFFTIQPTTLHLEHSLISLTRWEQHYKRPFLNEKTGPQTLEETIYYIKCMCMDEDVPDYVFDNMTQENYQEVIDYIHDPMTATTITDNRKQKQGKKEILTSELIYYYMTTFNIPFECEKWHLNNLITLIQIASAKNNPEKMSKADTLRRNAAASKAWRAAHHSKG